MMNACELQMYKFLNCPTVYVTVINYGSSKSAWDRTRITRFANHDREFGIVRMHQSASNASLSLRLN